MENRVFRKVSLDRLSSPEQLDQVLRITRPGGWIALSAVGLLLIAATVWSVVGTVADKVGGYGILVKSGGVLEVVASSAGRVIDVSVVPGENITEGKVIAWVAQPELLERLQQARTALLAAEMEATQLEAFTRQDRVLQADMAQKQRANLRESIVANESSLRSLAERLRSQEELVKQGLITRPTLLTTQQQHDAMSERIRTAEAELAQLEARDLALRNRQVETLQTSVRKVGDAQALVAQLEREFERASQIVSPYTGRVLEVLTEQGKIVGMGEPVLSLDLTGHAIKDLIAVIYVPSLHGKLVKPGMEIQIAPSTVRQEEHGMMLGRVTFVSDFPATPRGMRRVLKNDQLVNQLSGGGAPYEVHAELIVDPDTESQYRWSSSAGPPTQIQSGTVAAAMVTVSSQRPIAKVIPLFRRWTGT